MTATRVVRVLVVDDNAGFRESLVTLLDTDDLARGRPGKRRQRRSWTWSRHRARRRADGRPHARTWTASRPRGVSRRSYPDIGIVALTGSEDQRAVREMLVAGATGYVLKDSDGDEILHAVRSGGRRAAASSPPRSPPP